MTHDNGAYVTLGFADTEQDANEIAAEFWRAGRNVAVVRVADSEAMIGRQIRDPHKFAVVGEPNAR